MKPLRTRYPKITRIVAELLENGPLREPPIDIKGFADFLNIKVKKGDLGHRYGLMRRAEGGGVIVVNAEQSDIRQRFAIAHLLGHFLLHPNIQEHIEEDFYLIGLNTRFRPDDNVREREANYFALSLLIPSHSLQKFIGIEKPDEFDDIDLVSLGKRFSVTANMMLIRVMMERRYPLLKGEAV